MHLKARTPKGHARRAQRLLIERQWNEPGNIGLEVTSQWTAVHEANWTGPAVDEARLQEQQANPSKGAEARAGVKGTQAMRVNGAKL